MILILHPSDDQTWPSSIVSKKSRINEDIKEEKKRKKIWDMRVERWSKLYLKRRREFEFSPSWFYTTLPYANTSEYWSVILDQWRGATSLWSPSRADTTLWYRKQSRYTISGVSRYRWSKSLTQDVDRKFCIWDAPRRQGKQCWHTVPYRDISIWKSLGDTGWSA